MIGYRFFIIIFIFFLCLNSNFSAQTIPKKVTIYVHGTTSSIGLRLLSKFFKRVAFGQSGLHHINEMPDCSLLRQDIELLQEKDPKRFDAKHFYTFGWSGKLSFKAREVAGLELCKQIKRLIGDYKKRYECVPEIKIITMSHGGNVALNMLKGLPFLKNESIHLELILVAVPVQKVTEKLIESPYVSRSYVISSKRDLIQLVDCYKYEKKCYFPTRFFDTSVPNCHQIEIKINNKGIGHLELLRSFFWHMPYALTVADNYHRNKALLSLDEGGESLSPTIIPCFINDAQFRFYNILNLKKVIYGIRK